MSLKLRSFLRKCRLCLKKSINSKIDEKVAQTIQEVSRIQIAFDERLSNGICSECSRQLKSIETFVALIADSQNQLRDLLIIESENVDEELLRQTDQQDKNKSNIQVEVASVVSRPTTSPIDDAPETFQLKSLKVRKINEYSDKKCPICEKQFTEKRKIPLHIRRMHTKVRDYHCNECDYSTYTKFDIARHIKNIHLPKNEDLDDSKRICPECGKVVHGNSQLTLHINKKHLNIKKFQCDLCAFLSYGKYEMRSHMEHVHVPKEFKESFPCSLCSSVLSTAVGLKVHHQHKHSGLKPFECKECDKSFSLKETLKTHVRNVHNHERKFACELCPKKFGQAVRLRDHVNNCHGTKQEIKCNECGKLFHSRRNLKTHLIYHQEPRYMCNICDKKFFIRAKLKSHLAKTHEKL